MTLDFDKIRHSLLCQSKENYPVTKEGGEVKDNEEDFELESIPSQQQQQNSSVENVTEGIKNGVTPSSLLEFVEKTRVNKKFEIFKLFIIFTFIGFSFYFVKFMDDRLPQPLLMSDTTSGDIRFIEERAKNDFEILTAIGPRPSGSFSADVTTVQKIIDILTHIKSGSTLLQLDFKVQRPSGIYYSPDGRITVYKRISNVIAKLEPFDPNFRTNNSFLVNCHFDSDDQSPGAMDNMVSCVTMLEVLRVMSTTTTENSDGPKLRNSIIFLFNGAEETNLLGSHGFVEGQTENGLSGQEGHPWSKDLKGFLNLEGGGPDYLFQTAQNSSRLLQAFKNSVPRPYGSVLSEELYDSGFIPADTDFTIFTKSANISGLNFGYIKNGWVYHTKLDQTSRVPAGTLQHFGNNLLGFSLFVSTLDFDEDDTQSERNVYFDLFRLLMVSYGEMTGTIINSSVLLLWVILLIVEYHPFWVNYKSVLKTLTFFLPSWTTGFIMAYLIGYLYSYFGYHVPFYSNPWLLHLFYTMPLILTQTFTLSFLFHGSEESWMGAKSGVAICLLLQILFNFLPRTGYLLAIILIFAILRWGLDKGISFFSTKKKIEKIWKFLIILLLSELPPFLLLTYNSKIILDYFVPVMGRLGAYGMDPNLYMGLVTAGIGTIQFNGIVSQLVSVDLRKYLRWIFLGNLFVVSPLIIFGMMGIPFGPDTPMRVTNVEKIWYRPLSSGNLTQLSVNRSDSGNLFMAWDDPNMMAHLTHLSTSIPALAKLTEIVDESNLLTYSLRKSLWLAQGSNPVLPPGLNNPVKVLSNPGKNELNKRELTLEFRNSCPWKIMLCPGISYNLTDWSVSNGVVNKIMVPENGDKLYKYYGRPVYIMKVHNGFEKEMTPTVSMTFTFQLINDTMDSTMKMCTKDELIKFIDLIFVADCHDFHLEQSSTGFQKFLSTFPTWVHVNSWTSTMRQVTLL